jgi:hypothetical protein
MPRLIRKTIPKFTHAQLKLADLCARELWRGQRYDRHKTTESDEVLMNWLYAPFQRIENGSTKRYILTTKKLTDFISAADLSSTLRGKTLNKQKGLDSIRLDIVKIYRGWLKNNHIKGFSTKPADAVTKLGEEFFKKYKKKKTGVHVALASRILFFAVPNMMFFNYSNQIAAALGFPTNQPGKIIHDYYKEIENGLNLNWQELVKFDMPLTSKDLPDDLWQTARNNGWWQRRVLDLALLTALCGKTPKAFIQTIAATPIKKHP